MNKKYITAFILMSASLFSCKKDYLTTNPSTSVSSSIVESSTENLKIALNGINRYMYNGSFYGTQGDMGQGTNIIVGDLLGDDYLTTGANWFGALYQWKDHRNVTGTYNGFSWQFYYGIIGDINAILGAVDKATGSDADKKQMRDR